MSNLKDIVSAFDELKEKMTGLEKLLKKGKGRKSSSGSEDKPKREAGPWAVWASKCKLLHPEEFAEYKADHETDEEGNKVKGVHIHFATFWRKEHPDEYDAFAADLKAKKAAASGSESASASEAEKPAKKTTAKSTKAKKAESDDESESEDEKPAKAKKAPAKPKASEEKKSSKTKKAKEESDSESEDEKPKKKAPAKEEKKAPAKAKKEEKKVEKAKESEETENVSAELWEHKGQSYFRTSQNDCWNATAEGEMGAWAGRYDPIKDKIDPSATEPEFEH